VLLHAVARPVRARARVRARVRARARVRVRGSFTLDRHDGPRI